MVGRKTLGSVSFGSSEAGELHPIAVNKFAQQGDVFAEIQVSWLFPASTTNAGRFLTTNRQPRASRRSLIAQSRRILWREVKS